MNIEIIPIPQTSFLAKSHCKSLCNDPSDMERFKFFKINGMGPKKDIIPKDVGGVSIERRKTIISIDPTLIAPDTMEHHDPLWSLIIAIAKVEDIEVAKRTIYKYVLDVICIHSIMVDEDVASRVKANLAKRWIVSDEYLEVYGQTKFLSVLTEALYGFNALAHVDYCIDHGKFINELLPLRECPMAVAALKELIRKD